MTDVFTTEDHTPDRPELHQGVVVIDVHALPQMFQFLSIESTDTQGDLKNRDVFDKVHQLLLLPASYVIRAIYYDMLWSRWHVLVESPSLPLRKVSEKLPTVEPRYTVSYDNGEKIPHLMDITVHEHKRGLSLEEMLQLYDAHK